MEVSAANDHDKQADLVAESEAQVDSSTFECNICYELGREPVVTLCGHLYCWPCLYKYGAHIFRAYCA